MPRALGQDGIDSARKQRMIVAVMIMQRESGRQIQTLDLDRLALSVGLQDEKASGLPACPVMVRKF
jgi:hypothetical protein